MPSKSYTPRFKGTFGRVLASGGASLIAKALRGLTGSAPAARTSTARRRPRRRPTGPRRAFRRKAPTRIQGGQGTIVSFKRSNPLRGKARAVSRTTAINNVQNNVSGSLSGADGIQTQTTFDIAAASDISTIINNIGITNNTKEAVIRDAHLEMMLTNTSNSTTYVDLYFVKPNRDYNALATASDDPGVASQCWENGLIEQGSPMGASIVGSKPFDSHLFTRMWHSQYIHHLLLGPGDTVNVKYDWEPNVLYSREEALRMGYTHLKALTRSIMLNAWGQPIDNDTGSVTTAPIALDFVITRNYSWQWAADVAMSTTQIGSALPTASTGLEMMADTGIVQAFVTS